MRSLRVPPGHCHVAASITEGPCCVGGELVLFCSRCSRGLLGASPCQPCCTHRARTGPCPFATGHCWAVVGSEPPGAVGGQQWENVPRQVLWLRLAQGSWSGAGVHSLCSQLGFLLVFYPFLALPQGAGLVKVPDALQHRPTGKAAPEDILE